MNANAKKWVEALRSGEYQQTTGWLHDNNGFCCLGVACSVMGVEWTRNTRSIFVTYDTNGDPNVALLPPEVQAWLGLRTNGGDFSEGCLATLNDEGKTFAEIADLIESEPEGLFA